MKKERAAPPASPGMLTLPNALTLLRLALVPFFLLALGRDGAAEWVAFLLFALAAASDSVDGYAARRLGKVTSFGAEMDPLVDKVLVGSALVALALRGDFPAWAAFLILAREAGVTALRFLAGRKGRGFGASLWGKVKTGAQVLVVLVYLLPWPGFAPLKVPLLTLTLIFTLLSGGLYFRAYLAGQGVRSQVEEE